MKVYVDYSPSPDEWEITTTLELEDDGRFCYDETWTCYAGVSGGAARGRWRKSGDAIFFCAEQLEGYMYSRWEVGREWLANERNDTIELFGGITLHLRKEKPVQVIRRLQEDIVKPDAVDKKDF